MKKAHNNHIQPTQKTLCVFRSADVWRSNKHDGEARALGRNMKMVRARHIMADIENVPDRLLTDPAPWLQAFRCLASALEVVVVREEHHRFEPPSRPGIAAFLLVDASHLSVHTYADVGIAAVDLFVCKDVSVSEHMLDMLGSLRIPQACVVAIEEVERFRCNLTEEIEQ